MISAREWTEVVFLPRGEARGYCCDLFSRDHASYQRCPHRSRWRWPVCRKRYAGIPVGHPPCPSSQAWQPPSACPVHVPLHGTQHPSLVRDPVRFNWPEQASWFPPPLFSFYSVYIIFLYMCCNIALYTDMYISAYIMYIAYIYTW